MEVIRDSNYGALTIKLFVPPYNIDHIQDGIKREYILRISARERAKIN